MLHPESLALHLDLVGGLAGDMFAAGVVDALPALEPGVRAALEAVRPAGAPEPAWFETHSAGLRARRFGLADAADGRAGRYRRLPAAAATSGVARDSRARRATRRSADARAERAMSSNEGSSYRALRGVVEQAALDAGTRRHALALLALLAEAEAHVHGIAPEQVHFHELADWDSLLDIVAAGSIAAQLEGARWTASTIPIGAGTVRTDHGLLPVPAPATARLLEGYRWHDDGVAGERVTPTGAAILRHLVDPRDCGAGRQGGVLLGTGHGAGSRVMPGVPNIVRVLVVERVPAFNERLPTAVDHHGSKAVDDVLARAGFATPERIATLEFDVDDMTGEEIALAADHLRALAGVSDVTVGTRLGKKGRSTSDFRVLAREEAVGAVLRACFAETTTLGLRIRDERRMVLTRAETLEEVEGAPVRVKVAERPGGTATAKAEHDDVQRLRGLRERRAVRDAATRSALKRRQR